MGGRSAHTVGELWGRDRPRALIANTSGFEERRERIAVTVAVLEDLWAERKACRPMLLVVDEAHDVCPADPGDDLLVMRVDAAGDRAALAARFGFVPPELVELAGTFGLGACLFAGTVAPHPQLARTGARLTREGGADVPTDWAG